jgi:hypothetical protein
LGNESFRTSTGEQDDPLFQQLIEFAMEPFALPNVAALFFYLMLRHQTKRLYQMHVILVETANRIAQDQRPV